MRVLSFDLHPKYIINNGKCNDVDAQVGDYAILNEYDKSRNNVLLWYGLRTNLVVWLER